MGKATVSTQTVLILALAVGLTGCGGSTSAPTAQVRQVVNEFTIDLGQHHYHQACQLATGQMKTSCAELTNPQLAPDQCQGAGNSDLGQACQAAANLRNTLGTFTGLTISKLVIQNGTATVTFNGSNEVMTLTRKSGNWRVTSG